MAGQSSSIGNTATLNLILGIFLKLLGFFVVLYVYTDIDPGKAKMAEESLKDRFNISISLTPQETEGKRSSSDPSVTLGMGRAYQEIDTAMKSQIDFLSSEYLADSHVLVLRVPANIALDIGSDRARSFDFVKVFVDTLNTQKSPDAHYMVEAVVSGENKNELMRAVSLFVQKMLAYNYPVDDLMIGYNDRVEKPVLELRITEVRS